MGSPGTRQLAPALFLDRNTDFQSVRPADLQPAVFSLSGQHVRLPHRQNACVPLPGETPVCPTGRMPVLRRRTIGTCLSAACSLLPTRAWRLASLQVSGWRLPSSFSSAVSSRDLSSPGPGVGGRCPSATASALHRTHCSSYGRNLLHPRPQRRWLRRRLVDDACAVVPPPVRESGTASVGKNNLWFPLLLWQFEPKPGPLSVKSLVLNSKRDVLLSASL
jgi:hypothetical protein